MSEEALAALRELRDTLLADVPLARTREEHIRVTARAHAADRILALATRGGKSLTEPASNPSPSLSETPSTAYPVI